MKLDTLTRFIYIETRLWWEGGLTAKDLMRTFEITRQTAQTVLNEYRQQHPNQMRYDDSLKRHVATEDFRPHYIHSEPIQFLEYLRGQNLRERYLYETQEWSDIVIEDVDQQLRPKLPRHIIQPILTALHHQKTLSITYQSVTPGDIQFRIISPNHLVFVNNRYHLHAYCHSTHSYRDFVLSRLLSIDSADEEWVSSAGSEEWQQYVTLRYQPNLHLPAEIRQTLLNGYESNEKGVWEIRCRRNLAFYIQREMRRARTMNMPRWVEMT